MGRRTHLCDFQNSLRELRSRPQCRAVKYLLVSRRPKVHSNTLPHILASAHSSRAYWHSHMKLILSSLQCHGFPWKPGGAFQRRVPMIPKACLPANLNDPHETLRIRRDTVEVGVERPDILMMCGKIWWQHLPRWRQKRVWDLKRHRGLDQAISVLYAAG